MVSITPIVISEAIFEQNVFGIIVDHIFEGHGFSFVIPLDLNTHAHYFTSDDRVFKNLTVKFKCK